MLDTDFRELGSWVNRGKKEGRGCYAPALCCVLLLVR